MPIQKTVKSEMNNIVQVKLLGNVKTKGNVEMILCKRSSIDFGASGSSNSKFVQNITASSKKTVSGNYQFNYNKKYL